MKLWIRNMWKHGLYEVEGVVAREVVGEKWEITDSRYVLPLGEYATRERCLEIIDEIQELLISDFAIIKNLNVCDDFQKRLKNTKGISYSVPNEKPTVEYHSLSAVVYEMPEK